MSKLFQRKDIKREANVVRKNKSLKHLIPELKGCGVVDQQLWYLHVENIELSTSTLNSNKQTIILNVRSGRG